MAVHQAFFWDGRGPQDVMLAAASIAAEAFEQGTGRLGPPLLMDDPVVPDASRTVCVTAIKAARAAAPDGEGKSAGRLECRWQRDQLPEAIRELVLDDQRLRNDICWSVFD